MEECCECKNCRSQNWVIYYNRIECSECRKSYKWPIDCDNNVCTRAQDLLSLVNDNYNDNY